MRICAWCFDEFKPATHNQKYCSSECTRKGTNKDMLAKYHAQKALKKSGKRICSEKNCNIVLSRYNQKPICERCQSRNVAENYINMLSRLSNVE